MIKTDKIKDFKDSNNMLKSTKEIIEEYKSLLDKIRHGNDSPNVDNYFFYGRKVWVDRDKEVEFLKRIEKGLISQQFGLLFEELSDLDEEIQDHINTIYDNLERMEKDIKEHIKKLGVDEE